MSRLPSPLFYWKAALLGFAACLALSRFGAWCVFCPLIFQFFLVFEATAGGVGGSCGVFLPPEVACGPKEFEKPVQ